MTQRAGWVVAVAAAGLLFLLPGQVRNAYYLDAVINIFFWAMMSQAWNLLGGYAGQFSLGHTAFFGIGAYTSTLLFLKFGISPWLGMLAGGALAALVGVGIGLITLRLRGPFFALATIAIGQVALVVALNARFTGGSTGQQIPFQSALTHMVFRGKVPYVQLALALLILVMLVALWIDRSKLGFALIALREDEDAARAIGVRTLRAKLTATAISAFITAVGGTFYAQYIQFIDPVNTFSLTFSIQVALIAIVGGLSTPWGPLVGALIISPLNSMLRAYLGNAAAGLYNVIYGALLVIMVLALPQGVVGLARGWQQARRLRRGDEHA